jgi:uncharacterized membrane protein
MKTSKIIKLSIYILIAINLLLSIYLIFSQNSQDSGICLTGESCSAVYQSEYAELFGIKLSHLGVLSFALLLIVYFLVDKKQLKYIHFLILTSIGSLLALYFIYLQVFVIEAICSNCLIIEVIMFIIQGLAKYEFFILKRR